jgi:hypothetical protein
MSSVDVDITGQPDDKKEKKANSKLKNKLFALAASAGSLGASVGAVAGSSAFLSEANDLYPNLGRPEGMSQAEKIREAHVIATRLNYPEGYETEDPRFRHGGYVPRHLVNFAFGKALGKSHPKNEGAVLLSNDTTTFAYAHELGHRAQDYHKIAGPSQLVGNVLPNINTLATAAVSAKAKTNRGALAKGLLTSYALNLPRIASEITATRLGNQYLETAGIPVSRKVSALQPVGYLLQPAAEGLAAVALGRTAKFIKNKLQNRKKQKETNSDPMNLGPVY